MQVHGKSTHRRVLGELSVINNNLRHRFDPGKNMVSKLYPPAPNEPLAEAAAADEAANAVTVVAAAAEGEPADGEPADGEPADREPAEEAAGAAGAAAGVEERRAGAGSSNWVRWARG